MELFFASKKLTKIFNSHKSLVKHYGEKIARKIEIRLSVLESSPALKEVPTDSPVRCHELAGKKKGFFAVDVSENYRLVFRPYHDPVPQKEEGGIELAGITKIVICSVEDYH